MHESSNFTFVQPTPPSSSPRPTATLTATRETDDEILAPTPTTMLTATSGTDEICVKRRRKIEFGMRQR